MLQKVNETQRGAENNLMILRKSKFFRDNTQANRQR
jgi:hypothetical protein